LKCFIDISPTSPESLASMEIITNSFHIQGKTELAIKKIEELVIIIENIIKKYAVKDDDDEFTDVRDSYSDDGTFGLSSDDDDDRRDVTHKMSSHSALSSANKDTENRTPLQAANQALQKLLARAMYLNSIIENYQEAEKYLERALHHAEAQGLSLPSQLLCDASCLYWEILKDKKATQFEERIMRTSQVPLSRSKYLGTLSCSFMDKTCRLHLRINRTRPEHKEGERPVKIQRKLDSCYLDVSFLSLKNSKIQNLGVSLFTGAEFQLVSPPLDTEDLESHWYRATVCIYKDKNKTILLGQHHQLVLYLNEK